jgi:hypothetical protein
VLAWRPRHAELEERLLAAIRVAPERDAERFARALDGFVVALTLHMGQEEAVLLPVFDTHSERAAPNQRPDVVRRDHARLRELLASLDPDPRTARAVWERAERLEVLADVLHHHDRREADGMLAVLEAAVDAQTRGAWLARFSAEEAVLPPWAPEPLRPAPEPWPDEPVDEVDALGLAAAQDGDLEAAFAAIGPCTSRVPARMAAAVQRLLEERPADLAARRDRARAVVARVRLWRIALQARLQ